MTIYQADLIAQNVPAVSGVYPRWIHGSLTLPTNTRLLSADAVQLFKLGANMRLYYFYCDISANLDAGSGLTGTLTDGTNVYAANTTALLRNGVASTLQAILRTGGRFSLDSADQSGAILGQLTPPTSDATFYINVTANAATAISGPSTIAFAACLQSD